MSDGFSVQVKIEDNVQNTLKEFEKRLNDALFVIGTRGVEGAVDSISNENFAVDTGRLRASISFVTADGSHGSQSDKGAGANELLKSGDVLSGKAPKDSVQIGTNVEYAVPVHDGTSKMPARPFLRDGIQQQADEMEKDVKAVFDGSAYINGNG